MQAWLAAFAAKFAEIILTRVWSLLYAWVASVIKKMKRTQDQEKAADKFDEVVKDENSTLEQKLEAHENAVNSGRRPSP
jgi:hypothetical protein